MVSSLRVIQGTVLEVYDQALVHADLYIKCYEGEHSIGPARGKDLSLAPSPLIRKNGGILLILCMPQELVMLVQTMIGWGIDVSAKGSRLGNTLQAASHEGHSEIVQLLIEKDADITAANNTVSIPLNQL